MIIHKRILPIVAREGRIPQSVNLPSAWIFTKEGAFRTKEELEAMAACVVGKDKTAGMASKRTHRHI